jgi:ATP-dependent helicase HepA
MEFILKPGMYVWCPFRCPEKVTVMLYGQVELVYSDKARVRFYNLPRSHAYTSQYTETTTAYVSELRRASAPSGTVVKYGELYAEILPTSEASEAEDKLFSYRISINKSGYSTVEVVLENQIQIPMTCGKRHPLEKILKRSNCKVDRFFLRRTISKSQATIQNAPAGFKSLLGTRADLYSHQIDTIVRAFSSQPFRLMLADEVGLGKTIEACAILKGMREKNPELRSMIIVPDPLVEQWISELWTRFFIEARVWVSGTHAQPRTVYILPFSYVIACYSAVLKGIACTDLLIVDEAHKLLSRPKEYDAVLKLSKEAKNVLLLSATPVLRHSKENKKLLTLLDPKRYLAVTDQEFQNAINRQAIIRDSIFSMVRDLPDFIEYDLKDSFIEKLTAIQDTVHDKQLQKLISSLQAQSDGEKSLSIVRTILAYISEYYRVDQNIIRHRKSEIPQAQAQRVLAELEYVPAGINEGFYEQDCIRQSLIVFNYAFSFNRDPATILICKRLFQLTTSSPHAVLGLVKGRTESMGEPFDSFFSLIDKWKIAYDREIEQIQNLNSSPERFYSKVARLIRWIDQEDPSAQKKYLVFSEYKQTAELYLTALKRYYGEETAVPFWKGMNAPQRKQSVYAFQNNADCRFLVCDSSGGEGRNFQLADYIVHCDLSWSPAVMEQRIGRLDRIGRTVDQKVVSVVLHADYGVEKDLFDLYNEKLKVFTHSLCGMEIAFEEIQQQIDSAFVHDPEHGLRSCLSAIGGYAEQIEREVEQERYFDLARELDADTTEQLRKLVEFFAQEDDDPVSNAMFDWSVQTGIPAKRGRADLSRLEYFKINFEHPDRLAMLKNRYAMPFLPKNPKMTCTYSRKSAVAYEGLYFLAPSNALYDSIANNAVWDADSTAASLHFTGCGFQWQGFLFTWNISYDYSRLIQKNLPFDSRAELSRFLPLGQVSIWVSAETLQEETDSRILTGLYSCVANPAAGSVESADFDQDFGDYEWKELTLKCLNAGLTAAGKEYRNLVMVDRARDYFESKLAAASAWRLHDRADSPNSWIRTQSDIELFLFGMENPLFELDSAAWITTE